MNSKVQSLRVNGSIAPMFVPRTHPMVSFTISRSSFRTTMRRGCGLVLSKPKGFALSSGPSLHIKAWGGQLSPDTTEPQGHYLVRSRHLRPIAPRDSSFDVENL